MNRSPFRLLLSIIGPIIIFIAAVFLGAVLFPENANGSQEIPGWYPLMVLGIQLFYIIQCLKDFPLITHLKKIITAKSSRLSSASEIKDESNTIQLFHNERETNSELRSQYDNLLEDYDSLLNKYKQLSMAFRH